MRNFHNLSHEHKLTTDMGYLIPVCTQEVLPGDTFIHNTTAMARVAPMVNPLMHRVELRLHHWYVPNRIIWNGSSTGDTSSFEQFITGEDDTAVVPTFTAQGPVETYLVDHMGIAPEAALNGPVNALPVRAYNMIYNEFYRDQDLQPKRVLMDRTLARCAWQKDYFTVCRPSPQQGSPESIPIELGTMNVKARNGVNADTAAQVAFSGAGSDVFAGTEWGGSPSDRGLIVAPDGNASLAMSIDDLRRSLAFQRFSEARAMYGERYIDYLRFIGVNPSDGRLDRPEYLGGGKQILNFSEVLATAEGSTTEVGDMYGHGIGMGRTKRYKKMFEEHGWQLTLMSVRPKTVYADATPRWAFRSDNMDFWQKELEILPWQEVKENEIHGAGLAENVFGYVPRYEEYRHTPSFVSGEMRKGTQADWNMAREFDTPPSLNASFIECTPTDRIYSDANMPELIVNVKNSILAKRFVRSQAMLGGI